MKCEHRGCRRTLLIDCMSVQVEEADQQNGHTVMPTVVVRYYCLYHSQQYGHCWHCGFYAAHEPNFRLGLLGLCRDCFGEFASASG